MNTTETNDQNPWRPLEPGEIIQKGDEFLLYAELDEWRSCKPILGERFNKNNHAQVRTRRPRPAPTRECETCDGTGKIDQRLGGYAESGVVDCPDCGGDGVWTPTQDSAPAAPPTLATPATSEAGEGAGGGDQQTASEWVAQRTFGPWQHSAELLADRADRAEAELAQARQRIAELEKGITDIKAGTRIGWFMTDLGAKCSKLLNQ